MTVSEVCVIVLLAALVCAFVWSERRAPVPAEPILEEPARPDREWHDPEWLVRATHRRVIVHCADDRSVEGTISLAAEDGLLLWSAKMLGPTSVDLAGEVFIPRAQVVFVQTVTQ